MRPRPLVSLTPGDRASLDGTSGIARPDPSLMRPALLGPALCSGLLPRHTQRVRVAPLNRHSSCLGAGAWRPQTPPSEVTRRVSPEEVLSRRAGYRVRLPPTRPHSPNRSGRVLQLTGTRSIAHLNYAVLRLPARFSRLGFPAFDRAEGTAKLVRGLVWSAGWSGQVGYARARATRQGRQAQRTVVSHELSRASRSRGGRGATRSTINPLDAADIVAPEPGCW
jgi:hypothetical protein